MPERAALNRAGSHPATPTPGTPNPAPAGTCLAFDFGLQRIGVAVGEAALGTAHPLRTLRTQPFDAAMTAIAALVREWQPAQLVVGMPADDDGNAAGSALARRVARFVRQLHETFRLPVACVNERYSSVEAEGRLRAAAGARHAAQASRERKLDAGAAQVILEQFFSEQGH